jgi:tetraether lipid synthase
MTATLTKWYEEHGRHRIYAGGKGVELADTDHTLTIDPDAAAAAAQTDLDELGIAKTAREEKRRARRYHERMEQLYREHVLNEEPTIQIQRPRGDDR